MCPRSPGLTIGLLVIVFGALYLTVQAAPLWPIRTWERLESITGSLYLGKAENDVMSVFHSYVQANPDLPRRILREGLPLANETGPDPGPSLSWRDELRAWVYLFTSYDFGSPISFLEAELPGFAQAREKSHQIVMEPVPQASGQLPVEGQYVTHQARERIPLPVPKAPVPTPEEKRPVTRTGPADHSAPSPVPDEGQKIPNWDRLKQLPLPERLARLNLEEPVVAILHTHTSESYRQEHGDAADQSREETYHVFNTTNTGIVRVGALLQKALWEKYSIPIVRSDKIHDWPSYSAAYREARKTVQQMLDENQSVRMVLDIHRDGAQKVTMLTDVGGTEVSELSLWVGASEQWNPTWRQNFVFAKRLKEKADAVYPGLVRRLEAMPEKWWNHDLHPNMIIVEVGNYYDYEKHALAAADKLADVLAAVVWDMILEEQSATAKNP